MKYISDSESRAAAYLERKRCERIAKYILSGVIALGLIASLALIWWLQELDKVVAVSGADVAIVQSAADVAKLAVAAPIKPEPAYLGEYTITGYCSCASCCGKWSNPDNPKTASGTVAAVGRTVGADWATLAEGTTIEIEGYGVRVVEDKPAKWIVDRYEGKILDLYCESHEEALKVGRQVVKVWEVEQ